VFFWFLPTQYTVFDADSHPKKKFFFAFCACFFVLPVFRAFQVFFFNRFGAVLDTKYTFVSVFVKKIVKKRFVFAKKSKYR